MTCNSFLPFYNYNLFAFGNVAEYGVDVRGRAAIAGNATFVHFSVGYGLNPEPKESQDASLIVGGNLSWDSGANASGNTCQYDFLTS